MARKKGISLEKRVEILRSARDLIRAGVGRRGMDVVLRAKYGVSVSRQAFTDLWRQHQAQIVKREPVRERRVRKRIKTEADRSRELVRRGFIIEEAREFKKAQSLRYAEFRRMTATRQNMLRAFIKNTGMIPGDAEFNKAWRQYIFDWYGRMNLTTFNARMQRTISPWDWFDQVSLRLPPEVRYSAKGRRKNKPKKSGEETAAGRAMRMKAIDSLKKTLVKWPNRAKELVPRIIALGGKVPKELRVKAGL